MKFQDLLLENLRLEHQQTLQIYWGMLFSMITLPVALLSFIFSIFHNLLYSLPPAAIIFIILFIFLKDTEAKLKLIRVSILEIKVE